MNSPVQSWASAQHLKRTINEVVIWFRRAIRPIEKPCLGESLSFYIDWTARLKLVLPFELFVNGPADLDTAWDAGRFHAAGHIHGIAPEVVNKFCRSNNAGDYRPRIDADADAEWDSRRRTVNSD